MIPMFFTLLFVHFLADYPLQGDFLARAKNRLAPIPGVPWWQAMTAHAGIHAGGVALATGLWTLGVVEFFAHFAIDSAKCSGRIGYNTDQALHLLCKILYVILVWAAT